MTEPTPPAAPFEPRYCRLSLREQADWRELSRARRRPLARPRPPARRQWEVERVNRHGVVGYHLSAPTATG